MAKQKSPDSPKRRPGRPRKSPPSDLLAIIYTNAPPSLDYYKSESTPHSLNGRPLRKITISEPGVSSSRLQEITQYQIDVYQSAHHDVLLPDQLKQLSSK